MSDNAQEKQRLDQWLWYARFFKSRSLATKLCRARRIRIDGQVQSKASVVITPGQVLTFPQGNRVRVIKVLGIGTRRGPASEAQALYEDLTPVEETGDKPKSGRVGRRPTKALRRALDRWLGKGRGE